MCIQAGDTSYKRILCRFRSKRTGSSWWEIICEVLHSHISLFTCTIFKKQDHWDFLTPINIFWISLNSFITLRVLSACFLSTARGKTNPWIVGVAVCRRQLSMQKKFEVFLFLYSSLVSCIAINHLYYSLNFHVPFNVLLFYDADFKSLSYSPKITHNFCTADTQDLYSFTEMLQQYSTIVGEQLHMTHFYFHPEIYTSGTGAEIPVVASSRNGIFCSWTCG